MTIFITLFLKIIPLYFLVILGYIGGKILHAQKETVAKLLIYTISPVVVFYGVIKTDLSFTTLSLPLFFFLFCSFIALFFFVIAKLIWKKDPIRNLFAYGAGQGNTGYFGLPVAIALFGNQALGLVILTTLGSLLYENLVGFYLLARGKHSVKESIIKAIKLPTIYAFFAGIIFLLLKINVTDNIVSLLEQFKGAYTVLGMMLIGLGLSTSKMKSFDSKFIGMAFLVKFAAWPLIMAGLIALDINYFHFYTPLIHQVLFLLSIVPLAANTVSYATELKIHPEKASIAVTLSTIFALFFVPLMVSIFL